MLLVPLLLARTACPLSVTANAKVVPIERVPVLARNTTCVDGAGALATPGVLQCRDQCQVVRVDACLVLATVIDLKTVGQFPRVSEVRVAVSEH